MGIINRVIRKIYHILRHNGKLSSEEYINLLRRKGISIGERTIIFDTETVHIDTQQPSLIKIGSDVQITRGVIILTHGYDWSVLKYVYGEVLGSRGGVTIGNNVFIGMNTIILKGVNIGNNVIIGAGSVVTKDIPSNTVYAGSPAHFVCELDDYYKKRKNAQLDEAKELAISYIKKYNIDPPKYIFWEFFWLFERRDNELPKEFTDTMKLVGNFDESNRVFKHSSPLFNSYEDFLEFCKNGLKEYDEEH